MSKVRTRFAPSPTGRMHVGNLRTALYAYLIAKHEGGDFILRIEDTDQERYVEGALDIIYRTLQKTGLVHDEGPDKDGGRGALRAERAETRPAFTLSTRSSSSSRATPTTVSVTRRGWSPCAAGCPRTARRSSSTTSTACI